MRTILHVDLNNFFASVEALFHPELKDKYIAVCGSIEDRHGIVLAKNQKAKLMGVKTGMTIHEALKLCPEIKFVQANHSRYIEYSKKAKAIYGEYTDKIESFGIDEAWLDVTHSQIFGNGKEIADTIRERVKKELGLTVSVGVSFNKVFAKLGSDYKKPDATTEITIDNYKEIVWKLPVSDLLFVGKSTFEKLKKININTIGELANCDKDYLKKLLGKWGESLWIYANGLDDSEVSKVDEVESIKSVGNSITCYRDLVNEEDVKIMLSVLCDSVSSRLLSYNVGKARTLSIWVRDKNLMSITRQAKLDRPSVLSEDFFKKAFELFKKHYDFKNSIRSMGVSVTDFIVGDEQLSVYSDEEDYNKRIKLAKTVENIREKYGANVVAKGITYRDKKLMRENPKENHVIHPDGKL